MHAALSEQLGEAASWQCPPGGLFFWLQLNTPGIDTCTLLPEAMARGRSLQLGLYLPDQNRRGSFRSDGHHQRIAER